MIRGTGVGLDVASGLGDNVTSDGLAVGTSPISADGSGTTWALSVYDMRPAARKVIPSAVRTAGMIRVRDRSARKRMGRAW